MKTMQGRITRLQAIIKQQNLDALLVNELSQVRYLCGYTGSNGLLVVFAKSAYFITDFRYKTQIRKEVKGAKSIIAQRELYTELPKVPGITAKNLRVGYLEGYLAVKALNMIRTLMPGALLAPTNGLVEGLAAVKDDAEVAMIQKAVDIADVAFGRILQIIKPGVRESEVAAELEYQMKMLGSEDPSFETIIASGYRSALPHGRASTKKIAKGDFVTLDFGAIYGGYHSDITRTVVVGKASAQQKKVYDLVLRAQVAGTRKARSGLKGSEVDKHVRDIIAKAGYGKNFGHGLGHGIGLLIHEEPRLTPLSDQVLVPNMVVTCEPGIYIDGWGGVRIEDDLVITRGGCRVMNRADKSLLEL